MFLDWILWGGLGLIVGSFLNVLILRHGEKSILGRSACPQCGTTLQWFELVPVLSWILLRGRCRTCKAKISLQYPLVELLTAAGFLAIGLSPAPLIAQIIGVMIVALLIAIAVYDLYHTIIPDVWVWPFTALALAYAFTPLVFDTWYWILFAGPLVALPLFLLWLVSAGKWMGFGDVKFALGMGFLLGTVPGYLALMLAFILGAIIGVFILLPLPHIVRFLTRAGITRSSGATEGYTMKSEVPFGPFLICATVLIWFLDIYGVSAVPIFLDILTIG